MSDGTFDALLRDFSLETVERLDRIQELLLAALDSGQSGEHLTELRRELHTVKGNSAMMGLAEMRQQAHDIEDLLAGPAPAAADLEDSLHRLDVLRHLLPRVDGDAAAISPDAASAAAESVRVGFSVLDALIESIAELIASNARLGELLAHRSAHQSGDDGIQQAFESTAKVVRTLRDRIVAMRMIPLRAVLGQTNRIVHDEAVRQQKDVAFTGEGLDTTIDRAAVDVVTEAVGHLVRNAVVHGLETPDVRRAANKNEQGSLRLEASMQTGEIRIVVADDGGGIDFDALRVSARRRSIDVSSTPDRELLFLPEVSTRQAADLSAGRGIGMAAVQSAIQRIGGRVDVETEAGRGTTFTLSFPLSVSMFRALLLEVDAEIYALPLFAAYEYRRFRAEDAHSLNRASVIRWRSGILPTVDLGYAFGTAPAPRAEGFAVIVGSDRNYRAVVIDRVIGVIEEGSRTIDSIIRLPAGISSSTILPDGRVALVLDPVGLTALAPFFIPN